LNTPPPFQRQGRNLLCTFMYIPFHHKLIWIVWVAVTIDVTSPFSSANGHACPQHLQIKLDVKYKGTRCSQYWVRSNCYGWLRFQNRNVLRSVTFGCCESAPRDSPKKFYKIIVNFIVLILFTPFTVFPFWGWGLPFKTTYLLL
jgi:hypothetical protein